MENTRRIASMLEEEGVDALLLLDPGFCTWATWLPRSIFNGVAIVVHRDGRVEAYTHLLEYWRLEKLAPRVELHVYSKRMLGGIKPEADSLRRLISLRLRGLKLGCGDSIACREAKEAGLEARDLTSRLWRLRMVKTDAELERISKALEIAERALKETIESLREGVSELEVAGLHEHLLRRYGSEGHAFAQHGSLTIVAFGENTAYPHWDPTPRKLRRGEPVLIDTGGVWGRYVSDITRSFWFGDSATREWRDVIEAVEHAVEAAIDAVEPGVEAEVVDEAARRALGRYAERFTHSTGHGLGVEVHEEPRIAPGSKTRLEKGMVFTIEPGVYIPGSFGVRIEQMVVVGERGARILNRLPAIIEHAL